MKLKTITIENVKSFRERTSIEFDKSFNILIGPNAGGKSNLLDIITIVIRHYFVKIFTAITGTHRTGFFRDIEAPQLFHPIQYHLDKFIDNESNTSSIEVVFVVTKEDLENINKIKRKKEIFKRNLGKYRNGNNFVGALDLVYRNLENNELREGMELRYTIQNYQLSSVGNNERAYLTYLNNFELLLILSEGEIDLNTIYLYFSPYRAMNISNLQVNLSAQNFSQLYQDYAMSTSRSISSAIPLASLYFSQKRRKLEIDAKDEGYYDRWKEDEEVKLVTNYLNKLGYSWDMILIDPSKNIYELTLKKDKRKLLITQASSGEKEIINFLLGIFALNIRNGLIIIDEPDLHLHPKWQRLLIDLFIKLSIKTSNQFIIATHSAVFIDERTISNVIRIYRDGTGTSKGIKIRENNLPETRHLLHVVNSHNNEKLFFADKVVLVEGITDRLIFEKLISFYQSRSSNPQVVEVLEVRGKHNFDKYKQLLEEIGCGYYIVADLDYVNELAIRDGNEKIKALFNINYSPIDETIKDRKSLDGDIKYRHLKLKDSLTEEEINELREYIKQKEKENIFILCGGDKFEYAEIENFLPDDYKNLDGIIELTNPNKFENWLKEDTVQEKRGYLEDIVCRILEMNRGNKS
jgi:AAA15 family ATPase/GTPase